MPITIPFLLLTNTYPTNLFINILSLLNLNYFKRNYYIASINVQVNSINDHCSQLPIVQRTFNSFPFFFKLRGLYLKKKTSIKSSYVFNISTSQETISQVESSM